MNESDFIKSGLLEDYVLGLLFVEDTKKVEDFIMSNKEIAKELLFLRDSLDMNNKNNEIPHNIELRQSILAAIKKLE